MKLKLNKGLKLHLAGALPADVKAEAIGVSRCAVVPDDFRGLTPKLAVREGDTVAVGSPIFFDKADTEIKVVAPMAGTIKAIVRGDRRKILRIEIEAGSNEAAAPALPSPSDSESARLFLANSGMLALMRQRPYDIVPHRNNSVRDIFITAFDAAPLAADAALTASLFTTEDYRRGIAVMQLISEGKIYICHNGRLPFSKIDGAEMVEVSGPYPSSNAGVQIANIAPVDKGDTVWTMTIDTLGRIGRLADGGKFDFSILVAVVGPEVAHPGLVATIAGAPVADIIKGHLKPTDHNRRIISGNVLTGVAVDNDGFIRYPYRQITVIAEGDDKEEFMGWASLSPSKMSLSRTFPGHFLKRAFSPDARLNGGRRAMIMSGEYDKTMPMDILPEYLIKAIISGNIEDMEKLGIYEVAPEDFAAAEYADTSKLPLQQIVRDGLDALRKELE